MLSNYCIFVPVNAALVSIKDFKHSFKNSFQNLTDPKLLKVCIFDFKWTVTLPLFNMSTRICFLLISLSLILRQSFLSSLFWRVLFLLSLDVACCNLLCFCFVYVCLSLFVRLWLCVCVYVLVRVHMCEPLTHSSLRSFSSDRSNTLNRSSFARDSMMIEEILAPTKDTVKKTLHSLSLLLLLLFSFDTVIPWVILPDCSKHTHTHTFCCADAKPSELLS